MAHARRRACRRDGNELGIVRSLRAVPGVSVYIMDRPADLLVGYRGVNILLEVKDPAKPPSARRLTESEAGFARTWTGQHAVAHTFDEAWSAVLDAVGRTM